MANMDPPISTPPSPFDSAIILELPEFLAEAPAIVSPSKPLQPSMQPTHHSIPATAEAMVQQLLGKPARKPRKQGPVTVEDRLMKRSREAQVRFSARKKLIEAEQMKEVKQVPTIDPQSRKMAESNFLTRFFPEKAQKMQAEDPGDHPKSSFSATPKSTFLSALHKVEHKDEIQRSVEREQRENFIMVPRCHVSLPMGASTKVYLPVRLGPEDHCKILAPEFSQSAAAMLRKVKTQAELEEGRSRDPLDMTAEERNKLFVEQKQRKLQAEREKKQKEEDRKCTFTPSISRMTFVKQYNTQGSVSSGPSVLTDRSKCSHQSYTDRFHKRQELQRSSATSSTKRLPKPPEDFQVDITVRIPPPNSMYEAALPRAQPAPPREDGGAANLYASLSPTAQSVAFRSGCDFGALQEKLKGKRQ